MNDIIKELQVNNALYEIIVSDICATYPNDGVFVDAGAHVGFHTASMVKNPRSTSVVAIEAIEPLCEIIKKKLISSKVVLHNLALSSTEGKSNFAIAKNQMGYSGLKMRSDVNVGEWENVLIDTTKLDLLIPEDAHDSVSLIKIDIEGGEFDALNGSVSLLSKSSPMILFENGLAQSAMQYSYTKDQFFSFFDRYNYKIFDFSIAEVDSAYWDSELQTYMFIAIKNDISLNAKLEFVRSVILRQVVQNAKNC